MTQDAVLTLTQATLFTVVSVAAPPLLIALAVGIIVSVFQAVTSIQEPTLAFAPKILAVLLSLILFGPFMLSRLQELFVELYMNIAEYIK
ncbi:MAG: flagellar biosynthesis protein FliQ [Clostridiales bacterium]|jgi:flagellar biosynthetic protein FliQ|nr:flagellar biosynthesis protein FliQ [Clostridiales bacterium]